MKFKDFLKQLSESQVEGRAIKYGYNPLRPPQSAVSYRGPDDPAWQTGQKKTKKIKNSKS